MLCLSNILYANKVKQSDSPAHYLNPIIQLKRFISDYPYKYRILGLESNDEISHILGKIVTTSSLQTLEYIALGKNKIYPYSIKDEYQYSQYVYNWLLYLLKYNDLFLQSSTNICDRYRAFYLDLNYTAPIVGVMAVMAYIGNKHRQDMSYQNILKQDKAL